MGFEQKLITLQQNYPKIAYLYAVTSFVSLTLMQVFLKSTTNAIHPIQSLMIRGFCLSLVNYAIARYSQIEINVNNADTFYTICKRTFFSVTTIVLFLAPLKYVPAGITNSLFNTSPIIITFLQICFFNSKIHCLHLILTLLCFTGVILIIQPSFIFGDRQQSKQIQTIFYVMPLIAAFTRSYSMLYLHELKGKINNIAALQHFYIAQALVTSVVFNFIETQIRYDLMDAIFYFKLFLTVVFSYITQYFNTRALFLKKPSFISPFGYITILGTSLADILVFGQEYSFLMLFGIALTSVGLLSKIIVPDRPSK